MSGKPIECREILKNGPGIVEDISHMAIPRLTEIRLRRGLDSEGTATSGWSHKTWKNPGVGADSVAVGGKPLNLAAEYTIVSLHPY